jgi:predicted peptidase
VLMIKCLLLTALGPTLLPAPTVHVVPDGDMFLSRTITIASTEYHYRVFVPKDWTKKKKWPVILFLHGAGERGDDNTAQTSVGIGPAILRQQDTFPFVVVLPQCPKNSWWTQPDMQAMALKALEQTANEFRCDSKRIFLTGLSMGGYGSWLIAANNPRKFAALAIICGGVIPPPGVNVPGPEKIGVASDDPYGAIVSKIRHTPVWVFHGGADTVVPVSESRKMVDALRAQRGNVRYTEYDRVGHNSWDKAFAEPDLFPWLLSQHK